MRRRVAVGLGACSRVLTTTLSEAALPAVALLPPRPLCSLREEPCCEVAWMARALVYQSASASSGSGAPGSRPAAAARLRARSFSSAPAVGAGAGAFNFLGFLDFARMAVCAANAGSIFFWEESVLGRLGEGRKKC